MKRVIELEELEIKRQKYYKVKGCKTLFFDEWGFENLTEEYEEDKTRGICCDFVVVGGNVSNGLTIGQTYSVVDGNFYTDYNECYPIAATIKTEEDLIGYFSKKGYKDEENFPHNFNGEDIEIAILRY